MNTLPRSLLVFFAVLAPWLGAQTTPLRIEQTVEPQFPYSLSLTTITDGEARVVVNIDDRGKLVDLLVSGYTHKAFADEAVNVLKQWRYTAPTDRGESVGIRTELRFNFEAKGRVVSLSAIETPQVLLKQMGIPPTFVTNLCALQDLDRPLTPINPDSPRYPAPAGGAAVTRRVLVDFYVDERGLPRMPVVVNSADDHLAIAAVDALTRWRFAVPTRAGRPVSVRVRQEFVFPGRS